MAKPYSVRGGLCGLDSGVGKGGWFDCFNLSFGNRRYVRNQYILLRAPKGNGDGKLYIPFGKGKTCVVLKHI